MNAGKKSREKRNRGNLVVTQGIRTILEYGTGGRAASKRRHRQLDVSWQNISKCMGDLKSKRGVCMRNVFHISGPVGGSVWGKFGWYYDRARRSISVGVDFTSWKPCLLLVHCFCFVFWNSRCGPSASCSCCLPSLSIAVWFLFHDQSFSEDTCYFPLGKNNCLLPGVFQALQDK